MPEEKYLLFNLNDEKEKNLGEVISSRTARKIAEMLAEKEASESEIAKQLNLPLNTAEYNIKKLLEAGIIEKSKNYLWSVKGKKIENYKVANKIFVIAPKKSSSIYSKLKSIAPVVLISAIFTYFVLWFNKAKTFVAPALKSSAETAEKVIAPAETGEVSEVVGVSLNIFASENIVMWFLTAVWLLVVIFVIWSLKKSD